MPKKSVADLRFDIGDDGELGLAGFDEDDIFMEEEELEEDDELEEEEVREEEEEEEIDDRSSSISSRVDGIERTLQALPQMISTAIANAMGKQKEKEEDEEEIPEELTSQQMVNILGKRMEKAVKKEVGSIMEVNEPALRQARVTAEFQACASKYGQDFTSNMVPVARMISRIEKEGGKISAEGAYLSLKDSGLISKKASAKSSGKAPKEVRVGADSKTAIGDVPPRPKFNSKKIKEMSDTDVFQAAWNTALLSSAKRSRKAS